MKHLFFFTLAISLSTVGFAQQIKVVPQVGINMSKVYPQSNVIDNSGGRGGYEAGLDIRIGDYDGWFYWQPGVHYYTSYASLQVPASDNSTGQVGDYIRLSSFKIPLNGGMYLTGSDGILRIRIAAGFTPTLLLQQEESSLDEAYTDFQNFGLGANIGLGLDIAFVSLDAKYEYGLTKMYDSGNGRIDVLSLTLGVIIPPTF